MYSVTNIIRNLLITPQKSTSDERPDIPYDIRKIKRKALLTIQYTP